MRLIKRNIFLIFLSCWILSCEEEVELTLEDAPAVLVFDAWVNDKPEDQVIHLSLSQPYFEDGLPQGVSGATIELTDDLGNAYSFTESSTGTYIWDYEGTPIGTVGREFTMSVEIDGNEYTAQSRMNRVPEVDSVVFTYREDDDAFREKGYYGEFYATDIVGPGDAYWIRSYKNGIPLLRPFEINIAVDAGFSTGGNIDGVVFIQPIQDAVNPLNDDLDKIIPYVPGDSLYVEIHSISLDAFDFLDQMAIQTQRDGGFDEIFAEPLENLPTNIQRTSDDADEIIVGFFSTSAVRTNGKKLDP